MTGLLEALRSRRSKQREGNDYPDPFSIDSIEYPLQLVIPKPMKAPVFYDKVKLLELGFNDVEAEIALVLWEQKRPMFIFNRYRSTDLLREMNIPRTTIQRAISQLEKLGLIERVDEASGSFRAVEPKKYAEIIRKVLTARINCILTFLEFKQREYESL